MSEAGVGGSTRRDRIVATIVGLIAAAAVTGAALAVGMVALSLIFGRGNATAGPNYLSLILMGTVVGGTAGLIPAFLVGLPLHHYLVRMKWNGAKHYAALGAGVAIATTLVLLMIFLGGQGAWLNPGVAIFLAIVSFAGVMGGLTFWIIRRPDRDAPPIPDEVFA